MDSHKRCGSIEKVLRLAIKASSLAPEAAATSVGFFNHRGMVKSMVRIPLHKILYLFITAN